MTGRGPSPSDDNERAGRSTERNDPQEAAGPSGPTTSVVLSCPHLAETFNLMDPDQNVEFTRSALFHARASLAVEWDAS